MARLTKISPPPSRRLASERPSPAAAKRAARRSRAEPIRLALVLLSLSLLLTATACSRNPHFQARGVVEDVQPETGQIVIAHEDIPGLMPAMTMNFDVADRKLLDTLTRGDAIDFEVEFTGKAYIVTEATVRERGVANTGGGQLGQVKRADDPAPPFALIDQDGNPKSLDDFRGKVLLMDFIFTNCPGPCPILTGLHVDLQRRMPLALRDKTQFLSISLDPVRDTPSALREYAKKRGADLANWSFLTGPPDDVDAVLKSYGIGSSKAPNGQIEHVVATFLVDPNGQITHRYLGLDGHDPRELLHDIERLLLAK